MAQVLYLEFIDIHALGPLTIVGLFMLFLHAHGPCIGYNLKALNHIELQQKS